MLKPIHSIHHISAIVSDPELTVNFYRDLLGLHLVKQTVNYDDPYTYHLYFGDQAANPGSLITFFPWPNGSQGKVGDGQVTITYLAVDKNSLDFWGQRLDQHHISYEKGQSLGQDYLHFTDQNGLAYRLLASKNTSSTPSSQSDIPQDKAIQGIAGVRILSHRPELTCQLFTRYFAWQIVEEDADFVRLRSPKQKDFLEISQSSGKYGRFQVGTVHHLAFSVNNDQDLSDWKVAMTEQGLRTSELKNRDYFHSLYFRERGGLLIELATQGPGFTINEDAEHLGEKLIIPDLHLDKKTDILSQLPKLDV